ncbi:MAG: hypothetical protein AVDCRST_MAG93-1050, partial [uncultured Chloroflexia bacterium]
MTQVLPGVSEQPAGRRSMSFILSVVG